MDAEIKSTTDEVKELKACINDLVSVLALPAIWSGGESREVIGALLDTLLGMLRLDFAYAELKGSIIDESFKLARFAASGNSAVTPEEIGGILQPWLGPASLPSPRRIRNLTGKGDLAIAPLQLGLHGEIGWLVTGTRRAGFPTQTERLVLSVAANQAAVWLQEARLLSQHKRVAEELDRKVAQRTEQLQSANEELKKEIDARKSTEEKLRRSEAYLAEAERLNHSGSWVFDAVRRTPIYWSKERYRISGWDYAKDLPSLEMQRAQHPPEDWVKLTETVDRAIREKTGFHTESRLIFPDGSTKYLRIVGHPILNESGEVIELVGSTMDVTAVRQTEVLLAGRNRLLERVARGDSLPCVLTALCRLFEELCPGSMTSVLLLEARTGQLWHGAAPSLPSKYTEAINGGIIGPAAGSCGTAAYRGEPVIVSDIAADPLWCDYRDFAVPHGLRACWSMPIFSTERKVLGTFAIYCGQPGMPTQEQRDIIEQLTHLASIAIERTRAQEALRRSETYLAEAQQLSRTGSFGWNVANGELFWSAETFCITGLDPAIKPTLELVFQRTHPEDIGLVRETIERVTRDGSNMDFEHRLLMPDGSVKHVHVVGRPVKDPSGKLEFVGAVMDITAAKLAFQQIQELKDQLHRENIVLREQVDAASMFEEIIGHSRTLQRVLVRVAKVARTESTVLITGETGTGKELISRAIHKRSTRSGQAFVSVNCAAIPPSLIASELFGHEKGAFTGALQRRPGRFELAQGGTLFLDEVGELPAEIQVALLRVLQEREFERVGGTQSIRADVRLIAATNRDLKAAIVAGKFRSDLFYRLNVFPIEMPSLYARKEDIPMLTEYFIHRYAAQMGKKISRISRKTLELFQSYPWPGNVRELQNVIERSLIVCETDTFAVDESWLAREPFEAGNLAEPLSKKLATDEKVMIEVTLAATRGRISGPAGAAIKLGLPASTLESKIRSLKINKHQFRAAR